MSKDKKYDTSTVHDADASWIARVVRRRTSRGTTIERERAGFCSREAAQEWADEQLALYLAKRKKQSTQKKARRSASRARQKERAAQIEKYSFRELAERSDEMDCLAEFKAKAELLWDEVAFRMLKENASDSEALAEANARVGKKLQDRLIKAKSGLLDTVAFGVEKMAFANAQFLAQQSINGLAKNETHQRS